MLNITILKYNISYDLFYIDSKMQRGSNTTELLSKLIDCIVLGDILNCHYIQTGMNIQVYIYV